MRKIIAIGRCGYDILMHDDRPVASFPGGRILNAAASLSALGHQVSMVGEVARDHVGDLILSFLDQKGVDTRSIDRFTDGVTPTSLIFKPQGQTIEYIGYPIDGFDVIWPRIDPDDILVFGTYYSIAPRVRKHLVEIVSYAVERKALIVYLPGFSRSQVPRITRVMPSILENLEMSDIVISRTRDLKAIFDTDDDAKAYRNHIEFYCNTLINADAHSSEMRIFTRQGTATTDIQPFSNPLGWNAGVIAGVVEALIDKGITKQSLTDMDADTSRAIIGNACRRAAQASASETNSL